MTAPWVCVMKMSKTNAMKPYVCDTYRVCDGLPVETTQEARSNKVVCDTVSGRDSSGSESAKEESRLEHDECRWEDIDRMRRNSRLLVLK